MKVVQVFLVFLANFFFSEFGLLVFHFLPLLGAAFLLLIRRDKVLHIKLFSIYYSIFLFLVAGLLGASFLINMQSKPVFDIGDEIFQVYYTYFCWESLNLSYSLAFDGLSFLMIILTAFTYLMSIFLSFYSINHNIKNFYILIFLTQFLVYGIFLTSNLLYFYIYFEALLMPMFAIIVIWGSRFRKIHASYMFFFYTLASSLFMLSGLIYISLTVGSLDYYVLFHHNFSFSEQIVLWLLFFLALAVKMPIFPFHIWLPEAHAEAPTAGSMVLAGILLKIGGYGVLRFLLTFLKLASVYFIPLVYTLALVGMFYSSFSALRQTDVKRIVAYSSILHMSFMLLALFSFTKVGLIAGIVSMVSHGVVSVGLFGSVGIIYDRYGTRNLQDLGTLSTKMPYFYFYFLVMILANLGFPATIAFFPEVATMLAIAKTDSVALVLAGTSLILGAAFNIILFSRLFFGNRKSVLVVKEYMELRKFESFFCKFIVFTIFWLGLIPSHITIWVDYYSSFIDLILYNMKI